MNSIPDDRDELPLSSSQLAVWLASQLNPNDVSYGISDCIEINGDVNYKILIAAITHVYSSSSNFRLQFFGDPLNPRQRILPTILVDIPIIDFSAEPDPAATAHAWMKMNHREVYDLHNGPLFRTALLKLSSKRLYWYRHYHHLIADGFSMSILGIWMGEAYQALLGNTTGKPQLPTRVYGDYRGHLLSETEYRQSAQFEIDRQFWASLYSDLPVPTTLAVRTTPRRENIREEHESVITWLAPDLLDRIYESATALEINVGHVLIAFVALYVQRATGLREVALCMPTHGRERDITMETAGMCANSLPLLFRFSPEATVSETIKNVSNAIVQALQHRRYSIEDLKQVLNLKQNGDVPFRMQANILRHRGGTWSSSEPGNAETLAFGPVDDLMFLIIENRSARHYFNLRLIWNPLLYEEWEVEKHTLYLHRCMEQVVGTLNQRLREVCLTTDEERRQLLFEWNDTARRFPDHQCFHQLFEEQVEKTPQAPAVKHEDQLSTYAELNEKSNQLAGYLSGLNVGPGDIVGLCFDRSIDMIVALLAIMKTGGAYLPLDPDLPEARLSLMVKDAAVRIIVTHSEHELKLPDHLAQLVFVDIQSQEIAEQPSTAPAVQVAASDLAYVIYTSGSTGQPKGVLVQHDGLRNLAHAQAEALGIVPGARVLQFARLSFDASISEIAMTLASGGTLVLADKYDLLPGNLGKTLAVNEINVVTLPPSVLPSLRDDELPALKTLVVAGESCPVELADEWCGRCRVINAYGPTETTVCATMGAYQGGNVVSIGKPIANTTIHILDEFLEPVPIGLVGEIYVGGVGVSRGYLNRPELTQERFTTDPFSEQPEARLYKTGDLARYLPDGNIEFLGRKDQQVKIRGFRVELGEIEAALSAHEIVVECAVVVREAGTRKQLVAYAVRRDINEQVDSGHLRTFLRAKLPDYMIPIVVVFLDALPRTVSGKLDRGRLPVLDVTQLERAYEPPKAGTELWLSEVWKRALGVNRVGAEDNFFDIGGDSLAALNLIADVWQKFKIELPPQSVYQCANLRELADRIDAIQRTVDKSPSISHTF